MAKTLGETACGRAFREIRQSARIRPPDSECDENRLITQLLDQSFPPGSPLIFLLAQARRQDIDDPVDVEGLDEVIEGAERERLLGDFAVLDSTDYHDANIRPAFSNVL